MKQFSTLVVLKKLMKSKRFLGLLSSVLAITLSGCATTPGMIKPIYVSPLQYYSLSCEQIEQEMLRISSKVHEVSGAQQGEATKDAVALTAGLLLFWPALFFMMGDDRKHELAGLKGEYEALEKTAIHNNCGFVEKLQEIREEKKEN